MAQQQKVRMAKYLHGQAQYLKDTSRWGAWVREPKLGGANSWIFLGSHLTQRLAARCQDRALLKLETDATMSIIIQLTFKREDYEEDEQLRRTLSRDQFFDLLRKESSQSNIDHLNSSATACLRKFMVQEKALGNLSTIALEGPFSDIDLEDRVILPKSSHDFHLRDSEIRVDELTDDPIFYLAMD